jgi:uncharacterized repeat protein (TIGR03803 family)
MKNRELLPLVKRACSLATALAFTFSAALTLTAHAQTETVLHNFSGGSDGGYPHSTLISDLAGNLYGTTENGGDSNIKCSSSCGVVFKLSRESSGAWQETVIYSFTGNDDGANPVAGLVADTAGNLYGATVVSGTFGWGNVFKLAPATGGSWQFSTLHSFTGGTDGGAPDASLLFGSDGRLYGTTSAGGASGLGAVFSLAPSSGGGWSEKVIYSFAGGKDGSNPQSALIQDARGSLYGTTVSAGTWGYGTAYKLTPTSNGWKKSVLHAFRKAGDGGSPYAGLTLDAAGNLYGTTFIGGDTQASCFVANSGCGTVYELSPNSSGGWNFSVVHTFGGGSDGGSPLAGLTLAPGGILFGVTNSGGVAANGCPSNSGCGTVFKLSPSSHGWQETVLQSFSDGSNGGGPQAGLFIDSAGHLYGTATTGGSEFEGWGLVFEITP